MPQTGFTQEERGGRSQTGRRIGIIKSQWPHSSLLHHLLGDGGALPFLCRVWHLRSSRHWHWWIQKKKSCKQGMPGPMNLTGEGTDLLLGRLSRNTIHCATSLWPARPKARMGIDHLIGHLWSSVTRHWLTMRQTPATTPTALDPAVLGGLRRMIIHQRLLLMTGSGITSYPPLLSAGRRLHTKVS